MSAPFLDPVEEEHEPTAPVVAPREREPFVLLGVPARVGPDTFRRQWPSRTGPPPKPPHPTPEVARAVLDVTVGDDRARTVTVAEHPAAGSVTLPRGAVTMVRALSGLPGWGLIVSYSRGWDVNRDGTTRMRPLWERKPNETGKVEKKKMGEELPPAQECILVRAFAENDSGLVFLAGQWMAAKWDEGFVVAMPNIRLTRIGWQPSKDQRQGAAHERPVATLSEWLGLAPTMAVKPEAPAWPPTKGMMF